MRSINTSRLAVVNWLWDGELVQTFDEEDDIQCNSKLLRFSFTNALPDVPYHKTHHAGFWTHLNPARISVPR